MEQYYAILNSEGKVLGMTDERNLEVTASGISIDEDTALRLTYRLKQRDSILARKGIYPYCKRT